MGQSKTNGASITLTDNSSASPYPSTIAISNLVGTVSKVTATLRGFTHAYPEDIDMILVSPGGQSVALMGAVGGGTDASGLTVTFDDDAVASISDPMSSGTYRPSGTVTNMNSPAPVPPYGSALADFNGGDPNGTWKLYALDAAAEDSGSIAQGWALTVTASEPLCCGSNKPPVFASLGNKSIVESNLLSFAVTATDPYDGDPITLTYSNLPAGAMFPATNGNATFIWESPAPTGTYSVSFYAEDKDGTTEKTINITVLPTPFVDTNCHVIVSEYVEGASNNKALEIYNPTGDAIDLSAGSYVVQIYANGGSSASSTINLTGTIPSQDVFVLANSSAAAGILGVADMTSASLTFNGNDAVVLRSGGASGTVVDGIGQVGNDPGSEWGTGLTSTANNTLRRKATVKMGDTNTTDAFDPATEWDGYATDTFDGLGAHTSDCSGPPLPTPPILNPVGHQSVTVSNALQFQVVATPTDGDAVTLSVSNLPAGAEFYSTNENGSFVWGSATPTGVYSVSFYATDKDGSDAETISITVGEPGFELLAPVIQAATDVQATQFNANWLPSSGATGYLLDVATNSSFSSGGGGGSTLLDENFNAWASSWINGWTHNSGVIYTNGGVSNSRCVGMNATSDWIMSPAVTNPGTLSFYIRTSSDPGGWTVLVQTSPNGSDWTDHATLVEDGAGGTINDTPYQTNIALNLTGTFNVRWTMSARSADSCFIDNVQITAAAGGSSSYVPGYQNRDVANVTTYAVTGLTEAVTYYYRVKAYTVSSNSPYSGTTNVTTAAGVNVPPVLGAIGNKSVAVGSNLQFVVVATPTDGDTVTLTASNLPGTATFNATNENGAFEWNNATPTGVYSVSFYASDKDGTDSETISITVNSGSTELLAPVIQAASLVDATQFNANWLPSANATGYRLDVGTNDTFTGGGGGGGSTSLLAEAFATLTDTAVPSGWTTSGASDLDYTSVPYYGAASPSYKFKATGQWLQSPTFATGATNLQFWAFGNGGAGSSIAVSGLVSGVWTLVDSKVIAQSGATYQVTLNPQTTQLLFSFTKTVNCAFDDVSVMGSTGGGGSSFVPGYENRDVANVTTYAVTGLTEGVTYYYRAKAYNVTSNSPYSAVTSVVTAASSGTPPVLGAIGDQSVFLGETLQFAVTATPTESDTVTLTASNAPGGSAFYKTNELGTFLWTSASPTGLFSVTFNAADKDGGDAETIGITVNPLPRMNRFTMSNGIPASATFPSVAGQTYAMQFSTNIWEDPVLWNTVDSEVGTGGDVTLSDTNNLEIKRYYRIVIP
jgi:subtilisin-like proprotein convertase family protein